MASNLKYVPGVAMFLAGAVTAAFAGSRRRNAIQSGEVQDLKDAIARLEAKLEARESAADCILSRLESIAKLNSAEPVDVPSSSQIVAAMEQLLSRTMSSLDDRLTNQANAIEVLKTTILQADALLERVLESLDDLQSTDPVDPAAPVEEAALSRSAT